jgi:ABC-type multidrug transport system fused ATPase/permease subunit
LKEFTNSDADVTTIGDTSKKPNDGSKDLPKGRKTGDEKGNQEMQNPGKPKGNLRLILARMLSYTKFHRKTYMFLMVGFVVSSALSLVPPWLVKTALDQYLTPEKVSFLWGVAGLMLGASILQGGADYLNRYLAESAGQEIVYRIRQDSYRKLLDQSFSYFDQSRTGDLMSRITADVETLQVFFGFALVHLISNSMFIIGIFAVLMVWDLQLALLYLTILPFILLGISRYAFVVRPAYGRTRRVLGELNNTIQEQLQGIQVIKVFGREDESTSRVSSMNERYVKANLTAGKITSFWMPYVTVFIGLGTGLIIWYVGRGVIRGNMTLGTLVGFTTYIGMMMRPVRQTGMLVGQLINASAAAERIFEVLDTQTDIKDTPHAKDIENLEGAVTYQNVSFSYTPDRPVLNDISFSVKPGETVAIVGPTGAGKSSLIHLLPRFYDPQHGEILIDGVNIKDFKLESLRNHIGIVMQHPFLFNLSIAENIAFGRSESSPEEIRRVAQDAELDDFIMSLPEQYQTRVGERGVKLSGGQRQRLAIARTLLLDPPILILDEPTSAVDAETDEKIQKAIARVCLGRTVFVIAHRLWTIQNAHRILVINQGRVEQFGTPQELVRVPGLFHDIFTLQVDSEEYEIETLPERKEVD